MSRGGQQQKNVVWMKIFHMSNRLSFDGKSEPGVEISNILFTINIVRDTYDTQTVLGGELL